MKFSNICMINFIFDLELSWLTLTGDEGQHDSVILLV